MNRLNNTFYFWSICCLLLYFQTVGSATVIAQPLKYDILESNLLIISDSEVKIFELDIPDTFSQKLLKSDKDHWEIHIGSDSFTAKLQLAEFLCYGTKVKKNGLNNNYPLNIIKVIFTLQQSHFDLHEEHELKFFQIESPDLHNVIIKRSQDNKSPLYTIYKTGLPIQETIPNYSCPHNPSDRHISQKPLPIIKYEGDDYIYLIEDEKTINFRGLELQIPQAFYAFYEQENWRWPFIPDDAKPVFINTKDINGSPLTCITTHRVAQVNVNRGASDIPSLISHSLVTYCPRNKSFEVTYKIKEMVEFDTIFPQTSDKKTVALCALFKETVKPIDGSSNDNRGYRYKLKKEDLTSGFHTVAINQKEDPKGFSDFVSQLKKGENTFRIYLRFTNANYTWSSWGVPFSTYYIKSASCDVTIQQH